MTRRDYFEITFRVGGQGVGLLTRDPVVAARAIERFQAALPALGSTGAIQDEAAYRAAPRLDIRFPRQEA